MFSDCLNTAKYDFKKKNKKKTEKIAYYEKKKGLINQSLSFQQKSTNQRDITSFNEF